MKLHDQEIEKAVLAVMILDCSIIPSVQRIIGVGDFFGGFNKEVFEAINKLFTKNSVDLVSINAETGSKNPAYVAELTSTLASSANWEYYVRELKKYSMFRGFKKALEKVKDAEAHNIEHVLTDTIEALTNISNTSNCNGIVNIKSLIDDQLEELRQAYMKKDYTRLAGVPTGYPTLDRILGGLQSEYIIIGARPSVGKTSLATNLASNLLKRGKRVGFISAEMKAKSITRRMISEDARVNQAAIRNGNMPKYKLDSVINTMEQLYKSSFFIDASARRLSDVVASMRIMRHIHKVDVIFIDHAGMLIVEDKMQHFEKESLKSKTLKNLQAELDIPIILLSQLGRQSEGSKPGLSDLRGSGSYEEDADCVMFLHRDRMVLTEDELNQNKCLEAELYVAKNRDGEIGIVKLVFFPTFTRFEEAHKEAK